MFPTKTELRVLAVLARAVNGRYGLQIVDESDGDIPRGSIYVLLSRLESKGYVSAQRPHTADHPGMPRPVYSLTSDGRRVLQFAQGR